MKEENKFTIALKDYLFKVMLIAQSANKIDEKWGQDIKIKMTRHVFTDPINQVIQSDKKQVEHFNKIFGTTGDSIVWAKKIDGKCTLRIDEDNKEEKLSELSSQIYCHLSISLFDNLIEFLNILNGKADTNSNVVIDKFGEHFEKEVKEIDNIKIVKTPFIHILHSLRLCRNCITHNYSRLSVLEKKFGSNPELNIELFCYQPNETLDKVFLDQKRLKGLTDLYSQLAYLAYICCCTKRGISLEF